MPVKAHTERRNWTELNWHGLIFDELTKWTSNNALQLAPSNGVVGLRDCTHVRVNQRPIGSPCLPIGHFGQFVSVQLRRCVYMHALMQVRRWWRSFAAWTRFVVWSAFCLRPRLATAAAVPADHNTVWNTSCLRPRRWLCDWRQCCSLMTSCLRTTSWDRCFRICLRRRFLIQLLTVNSLDTAFLDYDSTADCFYSAFLPFWRATALL